MNNNVLSSLKKPVVLHGIVISLASIMVYAEVRNHHFVWDTIPFVLQNLWIHEWSVDNLIAMFTQAHEANWHPVVLLSHALDISVFGYDSGWHHLTNLLLHIINALLLYQLANGLLVRGEMDVESAGWVAFLTALIFAIHPQHVESVAWVVERKDVLYSLFALSCLLVYLERAPEGKSRDHLPVFLLFCLSVGAKPMAVTLPVVMLLLDVFPLKRVDSIASAFRACLHKWPYILVAAIVVLVTLNTQSMAMPSAESLPQWAKTLNAIDNSWFYIAHYLWPLSLSPFYPYPQDAAYLASPAFWLPGTAFLVISTGITGWLALSRKLYWPGLLLAFYLVTLLPVSGLIHVGPAKGTDHYVYLATIPLSLLTALTVVAIWQKVRSARLLTISLSCAYLVFLAAIAHFQVQVWNNPVSLWTRVVQLHPTDPFGHRNLASGYAEMEAWDMALHHAALSVELGSPDTDYLIRLKRHIAAQQRGGQDE